MDKLAPAHDSFEPGSLSARLCDILAMTLGAELLLVVLSGGFSVVGPVGPAGFLLRTLLLLILVGWRVRERRGSPAGNALITLVLLLLPLLHLHGVRLRGDALWYYPYARSLAFDQDLDFTNEYRALGIDAFPGSQPVRETGRPRSTFPIGPGLVFLPFVIVLGPLGVLVRNLNGVATTYDGYSPPYLHACALANLLAGSLGMLLLYRFVRRFFAASLAAAAVAGVGLGSFLLFYVVYQPLYAHAPAFLLSVLVLERWARAPQRPREYFVLGLLVGAAACLRWQNAVLGLLPLLGLASARGRALVQRPLLLGSGALVGFLPQLLAWHAIFGRVLFGVPQGAGFMHWSDPFLREVLFSSRHGLFPWSPILLLALLGLPLFVRQQPRLGAPLLLLLGVITYVNAAAGDWWAGGSFGARRFESALPIFALGLAAACGLVRDFFARRPGAILACLLLATITGNVLFMEQYRQGRLPADDTVSFETVARGMLDDGFDAIGYPFSFPSNWAFALEYGRPKTQHDLLLGKYLFHLQNNLGGVIEIGDKDAPFLGNGWSGLADWRGRPREVRFAIAPAAFVLVPTDHAQDLRVIVTCAGAPGAAPRLAELWLNQHWLGTLPLGPELGEVALLAPAVAWQRLNRLEFRSGADTAGPWLVLDRVRFEPPAGPL